MEIISSEKAKRPERLIVRQSIRRDSGELGLVLEFSVDGQLTSYGMTVSEARELINKMAWQLNSLPSTRIGTHVESNDRRVLLPPDNE